MHKRMTVSLAVVLALTAGACARRDDPPSADEGQIHHVRNSEFSGPRLQVFLTLEDGTEVSVNTTHDAVATEPGATPTVMPWTLRSLFRYHPAFGRAPGSRFTPLHPHSRQSTA